MFNLSENYTVDRPVVKCDYISYTLPSVNLVYGEDIQIFIHLPREDCAVSLKEVISN